MVEVKVSVLFSRGGLLMLTGAKAALQGTPGLSSHAHSGDSYVLSALLCLHLSKSNNVVTFTCRNDWVRHGQGSCSPAGSEFKPTFEWPPRKC